MLLHDKIVRVWNEKEGWMHEVRDGNNVVLASSKYRDELQEQYPDAENSRTVYCGDNTYEESRD